MPISRALFPWMHAAVSLSRLEIPLKPSEFWLLLVHPVICNHLIKGQSVVLWNKGKAYAVTHTSVVSCDLISLCVHRCAAANEASRSKLRTKQQFCFLQGSPAGTEKQDWDCSFPRKTEKQDCLFPRKKGLFVSNTRKSYNRHIIFFLR